jgi:hypothetical protein
LALLVSTTAGANTINFGSMVNNSSCSQAGDSGDRSCSSAGSVNNGANDATASFNVTAQSSADHGITTNPTAIADILVSFNIPYTVTRTVSFTGTTGQLVFPLQSITFNMSYSGEVSKDNSQTTGGLGNAVAFTASFSSAATQFTTTNYAGASQLGGGGLARTTVNHTSPDPTATLVVGESGASVGEITIAGNVPSNYRQWTDLVPAFAYDYTQNQSWTQSYSDTLTVSFRLRTESRPSGSVSATGGEALACFGQTSPLGSFALDNSANCGSGFSVTATVSQTGTSTLNNIVVVPEPSTVVLIGAALAGLAAFGARKRS